MKTIGSPFAIILLVAMTTLAFGEPAKPTVEGSTATYSGDQSWGISVTSATEVSS